MPVVVVLEVDLLPDLVDQDLGQHDPHQLFRDKRFRIQSVSRWVPTPTECRV